MFWCYLADRMSGEGPPPAVATTTSVWELRHFLNGLLRKLHDTGRTSPVYEIRQSESEPLKGVIWVKQRRGRGVVRIKCEAPGSSLECHWRSAASLMTNQHPSPRLGICLASRLWVKPGANSPRRHSAIRMRWRRWVGQGAHKTFYRMSVFNLFEKF